MSRAAVHVASSLASHTLTLLSVIIKTDFAFKIKMTNLSRSF